MTYLIIAMLIAGVSCLIDTQFLERENKMKDILETLSIALGYNGVITEDVHTAANNMLDFGMSYEEINTYAQCSIELEMVGA